LIERLNMKRNSWHILVSKSRANLSNMPISSIGFGSLVKSGRTAKRRAKSRKSFESWLRWFWSLFVICWKSHELNAIINHFFFSLQIHTERFISLGSCLSICLEVRKTESNGIKVNSGLSLFHPWIPDATSCLLLSRNDEFLFFFYYSEEGEISDSGGGKDGNRFRVWD